MVKADNEAIENRRNKKIEDIELSARECYNAGIGPEANPYNNKSEKIIWLNEYIKMKKDDL